jgi:hypothetical protein
MRAGKGKERRALSYEQGALRAAGKQDAEGKMPERKMRQRPQGVVHSFSFPQSSFPSFQFQDGHDEHHDAQE